MRCAAVLVALCSVAALFGCENVGSEAPEGPREEWSRISGRIERPVRGRLSSGSIYRICSQADLDPCGALPAPASAEFADAARLLARLSRGPQLDAESLHVDALARLALGGPRSLEVLRRLEAAAALAPGDRLIASDLLAARLARAGFAEADDRRPWLGARQAFHAVSEAVRLSASAADEPDVWFNYALVFESAGLPERAREGWRRFLALEPEGQWADEARQQLTATTITTPGPAALPPDEPEELKSWAEAHPLEARRHLEQTLLSAWASDPDAAVGERTLHSARAVAQVTERLYFDATVAETLEALERATPAALRRWAGAFAVYFSGVDAYRTQRFTEALDAFTSAHAGLEGVPFQSWASYRIAASLYGLDRYADAGDVLRGMRVDPQRQQVLESRRLWLLALVEGASGRLSEAVDLTEQALGILVGHPDLPAVASMHVNLAAPLDQLSQHDKAWYHRLHGLRASARLADPRLRHVALFDTATQLIALGDPDAALPFLAELEANAASWDAAHGIPTAPLEAALLHASALSSAGRHAEAARKLTEAVREAGELEDPNRIERLSADIAVEQAEILLANDPARALEELDAALETYRRFGYRYPLVRVHRLRGVAAQQLGRDELVEEAFREAVATHEQALATLEAPEHRSGYLAHAGAAYEALLRHLAVERANADEAFAVLERSRSVWSSTAAAEKTSLRDLQSRLAPDGALVAYRVLDAEVLVWWVSPREQELLVLPGGRVEITAQVAQHETEMALATAPLGPDSATAKLYERLFGPVEDRLRGVRRLAILPDPLLNRVAFAALADGAGTALVDSLTSLSLLPSARSPTAPPRPASHAGVVSVGDPAFDRHAFPSLDPLPDAELEAKEVAALYEESIALIGPRARSAEIEAELRGRRALHYAGHAVLEPLHPQSSGLLLAPGPGDDGLLTVAELGTLSLSGLDLVVLSACSTSGGGRPASEDWAEALLSVGVRGVVANRWEVEDGAARRFIVAFHRHRIGGMSDAEALLATQRDFRNEPPRVWAGFSFYGAID